MPGESKTTSTQAQEIQVYICIARAITRFYEKLIRPDSSMSIES